MYTLQKWSAWSSTLSWTNSPVALDYIYKIVGSTVWFSYSDIGIAKLVLAENCFDLVLVNVREWHSICNSNSAFILFAYGNGWWFFVKSYTKWLQFSLDYFLISKWFKDVEDDEDEVACSRD